MENKWYVTMTDSFMSGWGRAMNLTNKFIVECNTLEEAETIEKNAKLREEMKRINLCKKKPHYNKRQYLCTWKQYNELGEIWKK
jgi:hypothetical protein